jgi:flagellar motor switch protein FliM
LNFCNKKPFTRTLVVAGSTDPLITKVGDEVDALLRGLSGGEIETETDVPEDDDGIVVFDLSNQDRIIRGRMPVLEIINDRFARLASNAMANALRKRVDVNPVSIDMSKFGDFMRSLPVPTSINIFKMEPLRGNALMVVDTRLVFALVENLFGGSGSVPKVEGRDFTPIEQAIITRVVRLLLKNMEEAWKPVHDVKIELSRSEINPQFAAIVPPSDVVVVITFEVELENAIGQMVVTLPYATIEPIRSKLYAAFQSERLELDHAWVSRFKERLMEVPVKVNVILGHTEITGRQLLNLEIGDILLLDTDEDELLEAKVEGVPKFYGEAGFVKGNKAFQVKKEYDSNF